MTLDQIRTYTGMTFDIEQPLDDSFLELIKIIKDEILIQPVIKWVGDKNTLLVIISDYVSEPVNISYCSLERDKYKVFTADNEIGKFRTNREAVNAMRLLYFIENGVSTDIINYLANHARFNKLEETIDLLPETKFTISASEMKILKIDPIHRGKIHAKGYGI